MPIYTGEPRTGKRLNKLTEDWEDIDPINLKAYDIFKMFEPDGKSVILENKIVFIAVKDAFYNPDNENRVTVEVI